MNFDIINMIPVWQLVLLFVSAIIVMKIILFWSEVGSHRKQDLNDGGRRKFHFRGWFRDKNHNLISSYEILSEFKLRFSFEFTTEDFIGVQYIFTLGFCTVYLTVRRPLWMKLIGWFNAGREYGFYWYEGTLWMMWNRDGGFSNGGNSKGWSKTFEPAKFLFGKGIHFNGDKKFENYQDIYFKFRGKEYKFEAHNIFIKDGFWFRSRIPFGLHCTKRTRLELKIQNPPYHAGKGENSYDCDDDATFGSTGPYKGPELRFHKDGEKLYRFATEYYCKGVMNNIRKYGRADGDTFDQKEMGFEYIGAKKKVNDNIQEGTVKQ